VSKFKLATNLRIFWQKAGWLEASFLALLVAAAAGLITPGGPASAFPLLALLGSAGADRGILVAYITSWALLGVQRILVWDLPFMGAEFSATRFLVCLPLPILAGVIARRLPFRVKLVDSSPQRSTHQ